MSKVKRRGNGVESMGGELGVADSKGRAAGKGHVQEADVRRVNRRS